MGNSFRRGRKRQVHSGGHLSDGGQKSLCVFWKQVADMTNTEAVGLCHFAGVNDKALIIEAIVEIVEIKIIRWIKERRDDVTLQFRGHVFCETHRAHARHACIMIGAVTGGAGEDPALGLQFA